MPKTSNERRPISFRKAVEWCVYNEPLENYFDPEPIPTEIASMFAELFEIPAREFIFWVKDKALREDRWCS